MTNEIEGLDIWRHHARKAEEAARNGCNCRILMSHWGDARRLATPDECRQIVAALASDATRYALEAQQHAAIARTFRDGFQPMRPAPRTLPGYRVRTVVQYQGTAAEAAALANRFAQVGAL